MLFTAAELAEDQAEFDTLCTDTCRITRLALPSDPGYVAPVLDEDTGQYPEPARVTTYEGPCRFQVKADINSNVVETTAGEREWTYLTSQLQLPVHTPATGATGSVNAVDVDHQCEVLESPLSPSNVGIKLNIQGPFHKSQPVYLRFRVREVVG